GGGGGSGPRGGRPGVDAGQGVGVSTARNLEHRQGFFKTEASPQGVCFNPVTGQVAAIHNSEARIYHLSDPKKTVAVKGKFSGPAAFSGNGRYLVLATSGGGLAVFGNDRSDAEKKRARTWWKELHDPSAAPAHPLGPIGSFKPLAELSKFAVKDPTRKEVAALFARAIREGRTDLPGKYQAYPPHMRAETIPAHNEAVPLLGNKNEAGIAIYKLRKHLKKHPNSLPLQLVLTGQLGRA